MGKRPGGRRTYRELKGDPFVKTPAFAWLLERRELYIALGTVGCLLVGGFIYQGWKAYENILKPVEKESPYLAISPTQSQGAKWASEVLIDDHGLEEWELKDSVQPTHGFLQDATGNTAGEVPLTLLATRVASAGPVRALAQVYGAGQARNQFDFYAERLGVQPEEAGDRGVLAVKFGQGFLMVAGDAILGLQTATDEQRDELFNVYLEDLQSTLTDSGCADISATNGAARSLYFSEANFQGLLEEKAIEPEVNTGYLPTVQSLGAGEIANPYAVQPEAPLPASMPQLPSEVAKPTIATAPETIDNFTEVAAYKIQDPVGPGCGWEWSAQAPLEYDEADLEAAKESTIVRVQNEVNSKAQSYVDAKLNWARATLLLTPKLDSWNSYVNSVNGVHSKWDKLVADREALRPAWDAYLAAHENWSTFDARKAEADKSYNDALKACLADRKAYAEWEKEWGEEAMAKKQKEWDEKNKEREPEDPPLEPLPTPPAAPTDCPEDPERPAILDEQKPQQPTAPALPEDVTIPDSWPKPQ